MSDIKLTLRNHDSEWLLQRERVFNDYQVQRARRDTRPRGKHRSTAMFLGLPDPDPADQAKAAQAGQKLADRLGAGQETADDVLAMLGLTPAPAQANRRRHGQCRTCRRSSIPLRVNGDLTVHSDQPGKTAAHSRCDGSNTRPLKRKADAA